MRVILIRHGETMTSGKCYAGRNDVLLTPHGHAQAAEIAENLASEPIAHIFTSPLLRSIDTARPLARKHGIAPVVTPALFEIDFGILEGRQKGDLGLNLRKSHAHAPIPGGESLFDVWGRAGDVIAQLPWGTRAACAVVGHFWINRLVWGRLSGLSFEAACASRDYRPATGSCMVIEAAGHPAPTGSGTGGPGWRMTASES